MGAWLLLGPLAPELEANADTERDLFRTWALGAWGEWPDKGPRLDHSPLSLGPGWYMTTAPVLIASGGSVFAVHAWHIVTLLLGLALLQAAVIQWMGRPIALAVSLAIVVSNFLAQVVVRVWHPAQLPGLTMAWFACVIFLVLSRTAPKRATWLAAGWLLMPWMLQLHLVAFTYFAVQCLLTLNVLRKDGLEARWWLALSGGVFTSLCGGYAWALSDVDLMQVARTSGSRLGHGNPLAAVLERIPELLISAWSTLEVQPLSMVFVGLAIFGAAVAISRILQEADPARWVILQVLIGLVGVSVLSGLAPQARYFTAIIPGIFVLIGLGLHTVVNRLSPTTQWGIAPLLLLFSVAGGWFSWPMPSAADPADRRATPTLAEQSEIVTYAKSYGLSGHILEARLHGPVYGGLTALRWVDFSQDGPAAVTSISGMDVFAAPKGFPGIPPLESQVERRTGPGRTLVMGLIKRRYQAVTARVDGPCPVIIPYRWGALTSNEYREFDIMRGLDIERCRRSRNTPMTLEVNGAVGDSLFLLLSWYDVAKNYPEQAAVAAVGATVERIKGPMLDHLALYHVRVLQRDFRLTIEPLDTISSIDLY